MIRQEKCDKVLLFVKKSVSLQQLFINKSVQVSLVADYWKLKKLRELARHARFGKLKDNSIAKELPT